MNHAVETCVPRHLVDKVLFFVKKIKFKKTPGWLQKCACLVPQSVGGGGEDVSGVSLLETTSPGNSEYNIPWGNARGVSSCARREVLK